MITKEQAKLISKIRELRVDLKSNTLAESSRVAVLKQISRSKEYLVASVDGDISKLNEVIHEYDEVISKI